MQYEYVSDGVLKSARFSVVTCWVGGGQVFLDTLERGMDVLRLSYSFTCFCV